VNLVVFAFSFKAALAACARATASWIFPGMNAMDAPLGPFILGRLINQKVVAAGGAECGVLVVASGLRVQWTAD